MIIVAWIAVIVPILTVLTVIVAFATDGFTKWDGLLFGLMCIGIVAILIVLLYSAKWGADYIREHRKPVTAEKP